jgi:hypothetical protein
VTDPHFVVMMTEEEEEISVPDHHQAVAVMVAEAPTRQEAVTLRDLLNMTPDLTENTKTPFSLVTCLSMFNGTKSRIILQLRVLSSELMSSPAVVSRRVWEQLNLQIVPLLRELFKCLIEQSSRVVKSLLEKTYLLQKRRRITEHHHNMKIDMNLVIDTRDTILVTDMKDMLLVIGLTGTKDILVDTIGMNQGTREVTMPLLHHVQREGRLLQALKFLLATSHGQSNGKI